MSVILCSGLFSQALDAGGINGVAGCEKQFCYSNSLSLFLCLSFHIGIYDHTANISDFHIKFAYYKCLSVSSDIASILHCLL